MLKMEEAGPSRRQTYPVFINVSGILFETRTTTLEKYPQTLLGNNAKRKQYFCPHRNEYYFDRHRESFESILFFYQSSGKLYRPIDIDLKRFVEECEFYQLPEWSIKSMKMKEGGELYEHMREISYAKNLNPNTKRQALWYFIEYPSFSNLSRWFAYFYVFLLFLSITINCLVTVQSISRATRNKTNILEIIDVVVNSYFLLEFLTKVTISPCKLNFFRNPFTWIDLFALIPFLSYISYKGKTETLKPFQVFRVIRVFRLSKIFPAFHVTSMVLRSSFQDIKLFMMSLTVFVVFAGAIAFNLEHQNLNTYFVSIPASMYWAIQTCVTLGYGDIIPRTMFGKIFASLFIFFSIPILSIPVMSVIVKFSKYYDIFTEVDDVTTEDCDDILSRVTRNSIMKNK